jgi:hypothetical protein
MQLDPAATTWRGVELELKVPWLIVCVADKEEPIERTFFLSGVDDLLSFADGEPMGKLVGLSLVQPPGCSPTHNWRIVPLRKVERASNGVGGVVTDYGDVRYGGFPISPLEGESGFLSPLVVLEPEPLGL